jgi:hypothetical protein
MRLRVQAPLKGSRVLSPFLDERLAFEFSQTLDLVYKETARAVPIIEKFAQRGFFLLESKLQPPVVNRLLTQYILTPATLAALRKVTRAERFPLWEENNAQFRLQRKPFGLEIPLEFNTDPQTGFASATGGARAAIPYAAIHLPGVTPATRPEDPIVGKSWKSALSIKCGFGIFNLPYTTTWSAIDPFYATAESTFDPPAPDEKTATLEDVLLRFHPAGKWAVTYFHRTGVPHSAKGDLQYIVLAQTPGQQDSIETLNIKLSFEWKKVLLPFDNRYLQTTVWANPPVA